MRTRSLIKGDVEEAVQMLRLVGGGDLFHRSFLGAGALAIALGGAHAPAQASDAVVIKLQGRIQPACGLAIESSTGEGADLNLGDISLAGRRPFSFQYSCNAGFSVLMTSARGGLAPAASAAKPPEGFAALAEYDIALDLPTDGGGAVQLACSSRQIRDGAGACGRASSLGRSAIRKTATATLSWEGEAHDRPRLAGAYSDVLTIRMTPRM